MERIQISPSVFHNHIPMEKFKTNQLSVSFIMPLSERTASCASLLINVLKSGCEWYPNLTALGRALDDLYGAQLHTYIRKKGDNHIATFSLEFIDDSFALQNDRVLQNAAVLLTNLLFAPLLTNGVFDEETVARERRNLADYINARINDKRVYAFKRCGELAAKGQPYECFEYGAVPTVESITPADLTAFYQDYLNSANVEIFTFGRMDAEAVRRVFAPHFPPGRAPRALKTLTIDEPVLTEYTDIYPVEQAKLSLSFTIGEDVDNTALTLFLILFGASAHSLLFLNVREKLSLCYYCAANADKVKRLMTVYSGVLPENIEVARAEILNQLDVARRGDFSPDALIAAKKTYLNNLRSMADSMPQLEDYAVTQILLGEKVDIPGAIEKLQILTKSDIAAVAEKLRLKTVYILRNQNGDAEHDG